MNRFRWFGMTTVVSLSLAASLAQAAVYGGSVQRTHLKYSNRPSLTDPALR